MAVGLDEGDKCVVVDIEHRSDAACLIKLIATRQVPGDRDAEALQPLEHRAVAPVELFRGQPAAERIVDVRVGTGLVEHQVAAGEALEDLRDRGKEGLGLGRAAVFAWAVMHDRVAEVQAIDDVLRAIAPVLVEVEDADLVRLALGQQDRRRDHQPVEGAVPAGEVVAGMMEAGAGRNRADLVLQGLARCREHGAVGQRQAGGDGRRAVAEAVVALRR